MGGVTRAAAQVNLTQSAVSLQMRRLEEVYGESLIEKRGRGVVLTTHGEHLVDSARRILAANDAIVTRMSAAPAADVLRIGVPSDLLYLHVPGALRTYGESHPGRRVTLESENSSVLRDRCAEGALDLILTTEPELATGGESLARAPLVWIGAPGGTAWRRRPLPLGTVFGCAFTRPVIATLTSAGFDWRLEADSVSKSAVDGVIAADLAVHMMLAGTVQAEFETIAHHGALPTLPDFHVGLYVTSGPRRRIAAPLADLLRRAFAEGDAIAAE